MAMLETKGQLKDRKTKQKQKDRKEEGDTGRGRSIETDSGKIAKTDFSVVLPSTYFMIRILQSVMNNMMS